MGSFHAATTHVPSNCLLPLCRLCPCKKPLVARQRCAYDMATERTSLDGNRTLRVRSLGERNRLCERHWWQIAWCLTVSVLMSVCLHRHRGQKSHLFVGRTGIDDQGRLASMVTTAACELSKVMRVSLHRVVGFCSRILRARNGSAELVL